MDKIGIFCFIVIVIDTILNFIKYMKAKEDYFWISLLLAFEVSTIVAVLINIIIMNLACM